MAECPLPGRRGLKKEQFERANAGLAFNKFVDQWDIKRTQGNQTYGLHDRKKAWIKNFAGAGKKHGKADELSKATTRLSRLAAQAVPEGVSNAAREYVTISRFVTGLGYEHGVENGFVWHHTLGVPYLPSSGIKGMMRAYADHWGGIGGDEARNRAERIVELFGNYGPKAQNEAERPELDGLRDAKMGRLIVFDALPTKPVQCALEVMTPHDGGWRLKGGKDGQDQTLSPGDWHDPTPIPFLAVEEGQTFLFALGLARGGTKNDLDDGYTLLKDALGWIGAGAKTAAGYGWFESAEAKDAEIDSWRMSLKVGDTAVFVGRTRVRIDNIDFERRKVSLWNLDEDKNIKGGKDLDKLTPS